MFARLHFSKAIDSLIQVATSFDLLKKYDFDWEVLEVIVGGQSAIDSLQPLRIRGADEAVRFMECYGFDIENPIEKAELFGNFQEAMSFIRRYFLAPDNPDGIKGEIPRKIVELTDIGQLILMSSQASQGLSKAGDQNSLWACSIMKVMHTIVHMDKDLRSNYFPDIQKQILDRFYRFIFTGENEHLYLGKDVKDPDRVRLVSFDSKPKKSRDSVLLKLLHKPENVAEDIFDRVGIRFVTQNKFDAIRVIRFLKERYVIMPANIKPSRSKNTLIDIKNFRDEVQKLLKEFEDDKITSDEMHNKLVAYCENPTEAAAESKENPHSSSHYQSVQFTCRQLIKIKNPLYDDLRIMKNSMRGASVPDEIAKIIERLDLRNLQKEGRFFYPFEVQVLDDRSHQESSAGKSSHTNYKKSQIQAAMKRVMAPLLSS